MKFFKTSATLLLSLAALATCQPLSAVPIIEKIAPKSKSCAADNKDCRTASQAAPFIALGMFEYRIFNVREMAAVVSLIAFESGDFAYKRNMFPGRPGQGTANMQMAKFNLMYAKQIEGVKDKVKDIESVEGLSDDELNGILDLVTPDEYNFASGAWFLVSQCPDVRETLRDDPEKGYQAYMECVGVEVTEDRLEYWNRAKEAFGFA